MDMLLADRELARKNGQSSAAIGATELLGIELGMFTTRSDNKHSLMARWVIACRSADAVDGGPSVRHRASASVAGAPRAVCQTSADPIIALTSSIILQYPPRCSVWDLIRAPSRCRRGRRQHSLRGWRRLNPSNHT